MFSSPSLSDLGTNSSKRERKATKSASSRGSLDKRQKSVDETERERERQRIEHENRVTNLKKKKAQEMRAKIKELEKKISELPTQEEYKAALGEKEKAQLEMRATEERNEELKQEVEEIKATIEKKKQEVEMQKGEVELRKDEEIEELKKQIAWEKSNSHKFKTELEKFQIQLREEMIDKENRLSRIEELERDLKSQKQIMEEKLNSRIGKLKQIHSQENQYLEGMLRESSKSLRETQETARATEARLEEQILNLQQRLNVNTDDKERHAQLWKQKELQLKAKHDLELESMKARLTKWGHDLSARERRKEADEAESREARLKNDLRIAHDNYEKLSERSDERINQMESILDEMDLKTKPQLDIIQQWKQYRRMMEDHVDNLNLMIKDLREDLEIAQRENKSGGTEAGMNARQSLVVDTNAEPVLPAITLSDDEDENPVSPEVKSWGKIKRMMSNINLALGGERSNDAFTNSPASTPRRSRSHENPRTDQASAKVELENKKLKFKVEQLQFQLEKYATDTKHRQHRMQMRQDDDMEEWSRKKKSLEAKATKYKSEVVHLMKIIQEREVRINELNKKIEKQQEGLKVLREESEKYAREKKHWQDQYGVLKQKEKEHEAEMNNVEYLKQQNIKLAETIQELSNESEKRREEDEKVRIYQELAEARKTTLADGGLSASDEKVADLERQNKKLQKEKRALIQRIKKLSTKPSTASTPEDLP